MNQPVELLLNTADGTRFSLKVWLQGKNLRISIGGFLVFELIFKPQSVRRACEKILKLIDSKEE